MLLAAGAAHAQLSVAGAPVSPPPASGTMPVRWPDVAFGASQWLAVSGASKIQGQYFGLDGAASGAAFSVNVDAFYAQCPRVAFGGGAFLVTWHASVSATLTRVRGRLLPAGTADFDISPDGTNWEMGAAVAYGNGEWLVVWQNSATKIQAQRLSAAGAKVGGVIDIDSAAPYARDPSVAYDPASDSFLVAYAGCVGNDDCFVRAQRVKAGALVGTPLPLDGPINAGYVPEVALDAAAGRWLVVWYRATPGARSLEARLVSPDGTVGPRQTVSTTYASYDANSVAWSPVSGTFAVVTHATEQDVAVELDAEGRPLNAPGLLWGPMVQAGNFNPRIAARPDEAEFFGVTSTAFANLTGQRLVTGTRLLVVDAGVPDAGHSDAGVVPDAGVQPGIDAGTNGVVDAEPHPGATATCGCSQSSLSALAALAALCLLSARRECARRSADALRGHR